MTSGGRGIASNVGAVAPPAWPQVLTLMPTELEGLEERTNGALALKLKDGRWIVLHPSVSRPGVGLVGAKQRERSQGEGLRDGPEAPTHDGEELQGGAQPPASPSPCPR